MSTANILLSNPNNASLSTTSAIFDVKVEAAPPEVSISSFTRESDKLVIGIALSAASSGDVSVDYATSDGTAEAGKDYTATSGTLNIPAGQTSATINVPLL